MNKDNKKDNKKVVEDEVPKTLSGKLLFKFPDNSIYFGEVTYINEYGQIVDDKSLNNYINNVNALRVVRHGYGVELFETLEEINSDNNIILKSMCKYEGNWVKGKKHGKGKATFKNGDIYDGNFEDDTFNGIGTFNWKNNNSYTGMWKDGRMEGKGCFKLKDGETKLDGEFFNNNYINDKGIFISPFIPKEMISLMTIKKQKYLEEKNDKEKESFSIKNVFKVSTDKLSDAIENTTKNNRVPLVAFSLEFLSNAKENMSSIIDNLQMTYEEILLREYLLRIENKNEKIKNIYDDFKKVVVDCMIHGKYLILNIDDSRLTYNKNYDVNLSFFYSNKMLSYSMWYPLSFFRYKCWHNHLEKDPNLKLNKNFRYYFVTSLCIDHNLEENEIVNIIEKRFSLCLPLNRIDVLIINADKQLDS